MKIQEVIFEAKKVSPDDEMDAAPEDPEKDKTPHILMQLRKAIDVDGNYPISFLDGKKAKVPMDSIVDFVKKYMEVDQKGKEEMQTLAAKSLEDFMKAAGAEVATKELPKIKGSRYMSHFAGDYDEK